MKVLYSYLGKTGTILTAIISFIGGGIGIFSFIGNVLTKDVAGEWKITCHILTSSYNPYIGKSSGYKLYLQQDGEKITGNGEMFWVDDIEIPYAQHIRIECDGSVENNTLNLNYKLFGEKRTTSGRMELKIDGEDKLIGNFSGTAANSSGTVNGVKLK